MSRSLACTLLVLVSLSLSGCGCFRPFQWLFNRGDSCAPACPPPGCGPGGPVAVPYGPGPVTTGLPQVLPDPIEVGPVNQ